MAQSVIGPHRRGCDLLLSPFAPRKCVSTLFVFVADLGPRSGLVKTNERWASLVHTIYWFSRIQTHETDHPVVGPRRCGSGQGSDDPADTVVPNPCV